MPNLALALKSKVVGKLEYFDLDFIIQRVHVKSIIIVKAIKMFCSIKWSNTNKIAYVYSDV